MNTKNKAKKKVPEKDIDQLVVAQAKDDAAWGKSVRVRKVKATVTETIERAPAMATEKAAHDGIIRKFSGVGGKEAFANR